MINQVQSSVGVSGNVEVTNDVGNPLPVSGTVTLGAGSATIGNVGVTGNVEVTNDVGNPLPVSGTVNANSTVASQSISTASGAITIATTNFSSMSFSTTTTATAGSIAIQASVDGTNFFATSYIALTSGNAGASFNAATATFGQINTTGFAAIKFLASGNNGTVTFNYIQSVGVSNVHLDNSLPAGTNQIGTVEITNDVGNAIPVNLPIRTPLLAYYNSSVLYQTFATLIQPLDVTNIASVQISVSSLSTSAQISLQVSSDGGANWGFIAYLSVGTATYTTASNSNGPTYIRIAAASSATAGSTIITVNGTTASYVQSYLDNPAPSVIPFSSSSTFATNAILVGPIYCGNYRSGSVIISSVGTGMSLNAQVSLDGTNYVNVGTWLMSGSQGQSTGMGATGIMYSFVLAGAMYFRVITSTAITSGTSAFAVSLSTNQGFGPALGTLPTNVVPTTTAGSSNYSNTVAAATTNLVAVRATAVNISSIWGFAKTGITNYLKIFNTNAPTLGTTVPVLNIPLNGNVSFNCGFGGIRLTAGFAYAITLNAAPLDATAVALAGDSVVNFVYA
jgi:hypothetical protein